MSKLIVLSVAIGLLGLSDRAVAFDCAKASTPSEKAICADPKLKAADDALAAAYDAVMQRAPADRKEALKQSQQDWIVQRDSACVIGEDGSMSSECLLTQTTDRTSYLLAKPAAGPGMTPSPIPLVITRKAEKGKNCDVDVSLYQFGATEGSPGRRAFDTRVDEMLSGYEKTYSDAAANVPVELDVNCYWSLYGSFAYASDDLANLTVTWEEYSGGAHPNHGSDGFIADLKNARILVFADVFGDDARKPLAEACTASLREEKIRRNLDIGDGKPPSAEDVARIDEELAGYADQIAGTVADFSRWQLTAAGARVLFNPYDVGAYVEGGYDCSLPKDLLQRVAGKGGWIVP